MATRGKPGTSGQGENNPTESAANGNGAHPDAGPSPAPGQESVTIASRPAQFMIAPQQQPGLATFSVDFLTQQLSNSPDIEVVKTISPPRLFGFQSAELGQVPLSPLVLAKMNPDKAKLLKIQAQGRCAVERDDRLAYMLDPTTPQLPNPGVLTPLANGFTVTIEVLGQDGPLPEAEVYVFGSMWPAQGITDATGRATVTLQGETPETIRSILVKPKIDYWTFWLDRPQLVPNSVNRIAVRALGAVLRNFPGQQLTGWGERAMGLDRLPPSFDGAGIKIAIIDSGLAPTHRNLHGITVGTSIVGNDKAAWTVDTIGHGSHCAGIIAGGPVGPGGGIRGFAPAAEIHVCRIFPGGRFSDLVSALDYCMEHGIDVANMSLGGGDPSQIIEERIIRAKQMGMACIIAAGNSSGPVQFPASTPHCLAVAALGKWGEFPDDSYHSQQALDGFQSRDGYFPAKFSCFGPEVDVCAPGVGIVSSLPADGFGAWDGTSMATPHVTGLAALVLAHHPDFTKGNFQNRDARRVERLFQILKETATPLQFGDPNRTGAGLPNAMRALGLETGVAPVAASASATDPALATLRRLLGLPPADAPSMVPASAPAPRPAAPMQAAAGLVPRGPAQTAGAMAPQSVDPTQSASSYVARGPAQTASEAFVPTATDPDPAQIREIMHKVGLL